MLAEIVLTPQLFDEDEQADPVAWARQLKLLMRWLRPRGGLQPLLFSDLYSGSLSEELEQAAQRIRRNPAARQDAQQIVTLLRTLMLRREVCCETYPVEEHEWVEEAFATHARFPLHLIWGSDKVNQRDRADHLPPVRRLSTLDGDLDVADVAIYCSAPMNLDEQEKLLKPLFNRFSYIALINPYLAGSELDFTELVVRCASSAGQKEDGTIVDLHLEFDSRSPSPQQLAAGIRHRIGRVTSGSVQVRLFAWPTLSMLHRRMLFGEQVQSGSKGLVFKAYKGIALEHVARRYDNGDVGSTSWRLLNDIEIGDLRRSLYGEESKRHCDPLEI